jgi:hypothetical protein
VRGPNRRAQNGNARNPERPPHSCNAERAKRLQMCCSSGAPRERPATPTSILPLLGGGRRKRLTRWQIAGVDEGFSTGGSHFSPPARGRDRVGVCGLDARKAPSKVSRKHSRDAIRARVLSRHCEEPTGPARSGRPDDKLRDEAIQRGTVCSLRCPTKRNRPTGLLRFARNDQRKKEAERRQT